MNVETKYGILLNDGDFMIGLYDNKIDAEVALLTIGRHDKEVDLALDDKEALHYLLEEKDVYSIVPIVSLNTYINEPEKHIWIG